MLIGAAGFNLKVISNDNSVAELVFSVIKYKVYISTPTARRVENYCCLQFSFFSLGLMRADLSVCRFVGGMKVGSSRRSCKPD